VPQPAVKVARFIRNWEQPKTIKQLNSLLPTLFLFENPLPPAHSGSSAKKDTACTMLHNKPNVQVSDTTKVK